MADENASQETLNKKIASQEWLRGTIEAIGMKTRTGLIKTEDGMLVEFDESASTVFDRLSETEAVLVTLTDDGPDARGVKKAQQILPLRSDE